MQRSTFAGLILVVGEVVRVLEYRELEDGARTSFLGPAMETPLTNADDRLAGRSRNSLW